MTALACRGLAGSPGGRTYDRAIDGTAAAWEFIDSMNPAADVIAAGAPPAKVNEV
jgi:hypothetical protein